MFSTSGTSCLAQHNRNLKGLVGSDHINTQPGSVSNKEAGSSRLVQQNNNRPSQRMAANAKLVKCKYFIDIKAVNLVGGGMAGLGEALFTALSHKHENAMDFSTISDCRAPHEIHQV